MQERRQQRKDGNIEEEQEEEEDDGFDFLGDEEMIIECRARFLTALKGIYWDLFEKRQCSANSVLTLTEAVNYDTDNHTQKMNSWEFLKNTIHNSLYVKTLFRMRSLPIVGNIASNSLLNHISHLYDILSTYITAHTEVEDFAEEDFPLSERVINKILQESRDNRNFAQQYIDGYLKISFPEIIDEIKLKKAAFVILTNQMSVLNETKKHGLLDENAHQMLKEKVEYFTDELEELTPTWETEAEAINNNLKNINFFKYIPDHIVTQLINETEEMIFQRESYIYQEGERATYIFLIIRGTATETTTQGQIALHYQRKVGSMVSQVHLFNNVTRYMTSCIADAVVYVKAFQITTLRSIVDMSSKIEEITWVDSLYVLSKIYYRGLMMISDLPPETFARLEPYIRLMKYKKDQVINLDHGGILVKGEICRDIKRSSFSAGVRKEVDAQNYEEAKSPQPLHHLSSLVLSPKNSSGSMYEKPSLGQKSSTSQDNVHPYFLVLPAKGNSFRTVKQSAILHFENSEQIMSIIAELERKAHENEARMSMRDTERKSQRQFSVKGSYLARFSVNETHGRLSKRESRGENNVNQN